MHAVRFLGVALVAIAMTATGAPAEAATISSPGPIQDLTIGEDASCQASYGGLSFEFYPPDTQPGDCGAFVAADGELYSPDFAAHGRTATSELGSPTLFSPLSQSAVQGTGTAAAPFVVTTVVDLPGAGLELTKTVSYRTGSTAFRVDLSLRNLRGDARSARLFWGGDCYASGSDIGYGFTRREIRSVGCSQHADNQPAARTIQLSPQSAGSHFLEARYAEIWAAIATQQSLPDTCRCSESIDNGVALSWDLELAPGAAATRSLSVNFTESTAPAPLVDSDGDALPDAWETGSDSSLDYENLAPLGADPARKDIFVHADAMAGCAPPAGWERKAIDLFKLHGIALHVDSGPSSINADGSPWGTRSRAGSVPYLNPLPLGDWQSFDAYKDVDFVASNRRRAFHYVLFADSYSVGAVAGDGGVSRGISDSDVLIANCHFSLGRGDDVIFVHELGHNLGLRHGGADDINNKPNYLSVMNYHYAKDAIVDHTLPDYSLSRRPDFDENSIDERATYRTPIAWYCAGTNVPRSIKSAGTRNDLDFDCDGRTREDRYAGNVTGFAADGGDGLPKSPTAFNKSVLHVGQNDWLPGLLKFTGGGIVGALQLPQRQDAAVVPELTNAEVVAAKTAATTALVNARKRVLVRATPRSLRRGRRVIRAQVLLAGKPLRGARVRVRGVARVAGRPYLVSDRAGRVTFRVRVVSRKQVIVTSVRQGLRQGSVVLPVTGG